MTEQINNKYASAVFTLAFPLMNFLYAGNIYIHLGNNRRYSQKTHYCGIYYRCHIGPSTIFGPVEVVTEDASETKQEVWGRRLTHIDPRETHEDTF